MKIRKFENSQQTKQIISSRNMPPSPVQLYSTASAPLLLCCCPCCALMVYEYICWVCTLTCSSISKLMGQDLLLVSTSTISTCTCCMYLWRVETKGDRTSTRTNTTTDRQAQATSEPESTSQTVLSEGNGVNSEQISRAKGQRNGVLHPL